MVEQVEKRHHDKVEQVREFMIDTECLFAPLFTFHVLKTLFTFHFHEIFCLLNFFLFFSRATPGPSASILFNITLWPYI